MIKEICILFIENHFYGSFWADSSCLSSFFFGFPFPPLPDLVSDRISAGYRSSALSKVDFSA